MNIEYSKACLKHYNESPTFCYFFIFKRFEIPSKEHNQYNNYSNPLHNSIVCHDQKNHGTLIHHIL
jgi:hypothetical protein